MSLQLRSNDPRRVRQTKRKLLRTCAAIGATATLAGCGATHPAATHHVAQFDPGLPEVVVPGQLGPDVSPVDPAVPDQIAPPPDFYSTPDPLAPQADSYPSPEVHPCTPSLNGDGSSSVPSGC
jgi:hypothetical protein